MMTNETTKAKCIINPKVAKELIRKGHRIVDIKANKENSDKTVFVFEATEDFKKDMEEISNRRRLSDDIHEGDSIMVRGKEYKVIGFTTEDELIVQEAVDE